MSVPLTSSNKLAIVCAGGGMSCSYAGGAIVALADELKITRPDFLIAASGSAATAMYYLTGQQDRIRRIWTDYLATPRFFSIKRFREMMDVDYLIDEVIREKEPLDLEKLAKIETRYFIPVTNTRTGEGRYVACSEEVDLFELLRATKALPFFYGRKVMIDGDPHMDSGFKITKEDGVRKAKELGATHVLVIQIDGKVESPVLTQVRSLLMRCIGKDKKALPHDHEDGVFRVQPERNPASPLTRDKKKLIEAFELEGTILETEPFRNGSSWLTGARCAAVPTRLLQSRSTF